MHVSTILRAQKSPSVILSSYDESPHQPPLSLMNISVLHTFQQERELVFVGKGLLQNMLQNKLFFLAIDYFIHTKPGKPSLSILHSCNV